MAIVVPIVADTSGLVRSLTKGSNGLSKFGKVAAIAAGAAGVGALVATVKVGIGEFMEQEKVIAQTNAVLKSTKGVANVTAKEIGKLSESLMKKTGIDDEAIQSGQNLLLTFTKVRNEAGKGNDIFSQATVLMADLSVAMGKDMTSSAMLVGKALNDPIKGVSALSRAGVQFTKDQKAQIEAMVESGNVMGAQKMILKELETQFGGSAEAAGKTLGGQLNILKQSFNNMAGDLVAKFMPNVTRAAQALVDFLDKFVSAPTLNAKVAVVTGAIGDVWQKIKDWWNTGERKELPSGIRLTPPGKQQVNDAIEDMFINVANASKRFATDAGYEMASWIIRAFRGGASDRASSAGGHFIRQLFVNTDAMKAAYRLVSWIIDGIQKAFNDANVSFGSILRGWMFRGNDPYTIVTGIGEGLGKTLVDAIKRATRTAKPIDPFIGLIQRSGKKNRLTETVSQAIADARNQIVGLGSSLSSMVATVRGAGATTNSRASGAILADQRQLEDERYAIQEKQLRDAKDAAEATEDDKLAYREFVLQREQQLRARDLEDQESTDKAKIDSLVGEFNRGKLSAEQFSNELRTYLGADFGFSLGTEFGNAFRNEFESIINLAKDIWNTVGGLNPTGPAAGNVVSSALRESNQARFDKALSEWQQDQEEWAKKKKQLKDKDISEKTFNDWVKKNRPGRPRPQRKDYGLALGGILKKTVFSAGEAGPEAVMPLSGRGGVMLRDALGMNERQGSTYNITVNAGMGASGTDLGREIVEAIKKYERTNGNVFASA